MTGLVLLLRKSVAVNLGYVLNEGIMTGGVKKEIGEKVTGDGLIAITNQHLLMGADEQENDAPDRIEQRKE